MNEEMKKKLVEMAKKRGLDVAEGAAGDLAELAIDVVKALVQASENTYDDMIFAALEGKAREALGDLVDKIDGEEG